MTDDPHSSSGSKDPITLSSPLKFSNIAGIRITPDRNIEVTGQIDQGFITFEFPGTSTAILSALFSAYACELGIGGKEEKEFANLLLTGFELRVPTKNGMVPLLLKCKPDLNLWFTLPAAALEDMGKAFLSAAQTLATEQPPTDKS